MAPTEQYIAQRVQFDRVNLDPMFGGRDGTAVVVDELAAREALRAQISKLERELSGLVARTFPHVSPRDCGGESFSGPRLLTLAELERLRDRRSHRLRRGARELRAHCDGRKVDLRQRRDGEQRIGDETDQQKRQHQQRGCDRTANEAFGKPSGHFDQLR